MESLVNQGVELAILGMGTVFAFLVVLIFVTRLMSSLVLRFDSAAGAPAVSAATQIRPAPDQARLIAIISAAITEHRKTRP